jgi:hypothetical protein
MDFFTFIQNFTVLGINPNTVFAMCVILELCKVLFLSDLLNGLDKVKINWIKSIALKFGIDKVKFIVLLITAFLVSFAVCACISIKHFVFYPVFEMSAKTFFVGGLAYEIFKKLFGDQFSFYGKKEKIDEGDDGK